MPIAIKMPALSPTMEEGTLAKWLVKVGDTVAAGDIMAEIETDKATMEFEAVDEGTVADISVDEGTEGVAVGTVIMTLAEEVFGALQPRPRREIARPRLLPRRRKRLPRRTKPLRPHPRRNRRPLRRRTWPRLPPRRPSTATG